jgi:flagellum-specific ATP synthase
MNERSSILSKYRYALSTNNFITYSGRVSRIIGLTIESVGPAVEIGEICRIQTLKGSETFEAEVVGFREETVLLMPLGDMSGVGPGSKVFSTGHYLQVGVGESLLGRVLDGLGEPIDGKPKPVLRKKYKANNDPPNPLLRKRITDSMPLGIKAIDGVLTCANGQRVGIFAGSGVGKSTLLGMIARNTEADVNVIALIGERGREVREFLENDLGEEGLKRSVVVCATSDKPALMRVKAAMIATSIAEYFRDMGKNVVFMMDSVTRFCMAQREVGLAIGEPPVTRGYTPSVFAILPKLLERAGNSDTGSITGLYTVLVDGDDMNEPIADAVRGILDGHIILSRKLAGKGHYPAIDIMNSASRVMPAVVEDGHLKASMKLKELMSIYKDSEDLINIGAYKYGASKKIDTAIDKIGDIESFLKQGVHDNISYEDVKSTLVGIVEDVD